MMREGAPDVVRPKLFLEAALNGARDPASNPYLPVTPAQLAEAARTSVAAGADAIHLHVRGRDGRESLDASAVAAALTEVRAACPHTALGISTGLWIVAGPRERLDAVRSWEVLPGFASVNFDEPGAAELTALLLERGVGVEAGVATPAAASALVASGHADRCLRILLEPQEQELSLARQGVARMERVLDDARVAAPRLLHGVDATAWPLLGDAAEAGDLARIGLEDTLVLPDGTAAGSNAALVSAARLLEAGGHR